MALECLACLPHGSGDECLRRKAISHFTNITGCTFNYSRRTPSMRCRSQNSGDVRRRPKTFLLWVSDMYVTSCQVRSWGTTNHNSLLVSLTSLRTPVWMSYARPTIWVLFLIKGEALSMDISSLILASMLGGNR
jgi:hypothetical protein